MSRVMKDARIGVIVFGVLNALLVLGVQSPKLLEKEFEFRVSLATFNVQNLFDTKRDPLKEDWTFLPIEQKQNPTHRRSCYAIRTRKWRQECLNLDWNEDRLKEKIIEIGRVIKMANNGRGPDLIFLQEIENLEVLRMLVDHSLNGMGYKAILLEGSDPRGIDVGILTRLPLHKSPRLIEIPYSKGRSRKKSRPLLLVDLMLPNGQVLTAIGLHLPSAAAPPYVREEALEFIQRYVAELGSELTVIGGDFNISSLEAKKHRSIERFAKEKWSVSHLEGCRSCRGTAFFGGKPSFLDMIWLREGKHGWKIYGPSVKTLPSPVSDHHALILDLVKR